jgi:hypothetical protein
METQPIILDILRSIKNKDVYSNSCVEFEGYYYNIGCCDCLKSSGNEYNYWNSKLHIPNIPYTLWWTKEWIKILPEIEERIEITEERITLLSINSLPKKENIWYKQHFIWTLLRSSYYSTIGQKVYNTLLKNSDINFLETLRFFLIIDGNRLNRFITQGLFFSTNIEKAREVFNRGIFKRMYMPFHGHECAVISKSILIGVNGLRKRINVINDYFLPLEELCSLDKSGVLLFQKENIIYRITNYCENVYFKEIGILMKEDFIVSSNNLRSFTIPKTTLLEEVNRDLVPADFNFTQYYIYL